MTRLGFVFSLLLLPSAISPAPAAEVLPLQITRGPYLQLLLADSVEILWHTDALSAGAVEISEAGGGDPRRIAEDRPAAEHRVKITGLAPDCEHRYRVLDGDQPLGGEFRLRTAPPTGQGTVRVAVAGDSGYQGSEGQLAVAAVIKAMEPDLFVHTGDLSYFDDLDGDVFGPYREILSRTCLYTSRGNHDLRWIWFGALHPHLDDPRETATFYSFDWGCAHFVTIDTNSFSNDPIQTSEQVRFLEADLEAAQGRGIPWKIVFFHYPPYTVGPGAITSPELNASVREGVAPLADRYGVDLVLYGHDHIYQRTHPLRDSVPRDAWQPHSTYVLPRGTVYLGTGGGGGVLYSIAKTSRLTPTSAKGYHAVELVITPEMLSGRAISPTDGVLDEFRIVKTGPRPPFTFLRGDADGTAILDIADAIQILGYLFLGSRSPDCPAAVDVDANGEVNLGDPVTLLNYLFLGGNPPAPPSPECAPAPQADDAWCVRTGC